MLMTREQQRIYDAAQVFCGSAREDTLAALITAVMDLPMAQWPAEACEHKPKKAIPAVSDELQAKRKTSMGQLLAAIAPHVTAQPTKPEPGDAAYPDRVIDLETGRKPKNASR